MARTEREKLVRLGLRSPVSSGSVINSLIETLQNNIAQEWATYQENFDDASLGSWSDYETFLTDNGISSSRASSIRSKLESSYDSFSDFKDATLNKYKSWSDFRSDFGSTTDFGSDLKTDDGTAVAGIRVFEEAGTTKNDVEIPQGGTEIWGKEIHFSESPAEGSEIQPDKDNDDSVGNLESPIEYGPTELSDQNVDDPNASPPKVKADGDVITFRCDITNNTNYNRSIQVDRIVDGEVYLTFELTVNANDTSAAIQQFLVDGDEPLTIGTHSVAFNKATPQDVEIIPEDV